jgi:DNA mismatch repair protein MSH4
LQKDGTGAAMAQFCDSHNYAQTMIFLEIYSPTDILLSDTAANTDLTKLLTLRFGAEASIVSVQRKLFSETQGTRTSNAGDRARDFSHYSSKGLYFLENLAIEQEGGLSAAISTKYLALASFAAAVAYAEHALRANFIKGSVRVRFVGADRTLLYDPQSVAALELLCDRINGDKKKGLVPVIDRCTTAHGKALLRANVLQPSTDLATICERQRAALEISDDHVFENVKICLKDAVDIDRMRMSALKLMRTFFSDTLSLSLPDDEIADGKRGSCCEEPTVEFHYASSSLGQDSIDSTINLFVFMRDSDSRPREF